MCVIIIRVEKIFKKKLILGLVQQAKGTHSVECPLYIGETKQPIHKRMAQHRRASSSGNDSAVHLHLKDKGHSFEDHNVRVLAREDRWFERGVKEAIYVKLEKPSLNRGGGLRFNLPSIYNSVLTSVPRKFQQHSHLEPPGSHHQQPR